MTMDRPQRGSARAFYRLAIPLITSRAGLAVMGMADALMVSRYGAHEFAWLSLAEGTLGRVLDVCVAFLIGGLSLVPRAAASGDTGLAHRLWRRTIPVAIALGVCGLLAAVAGRFVLQAAGQPPELIDGASRVMRVLGVGYPAALLAISAAVYLEGIGRPQVVAAAVVAANVLNVALNWLLIGGHWGLPAMGATGSAWSTTIVRAGLAVVLVVWALRHSGVNPRQSSAALGREQWRLGCGAAATVGVLVALTAMLTAFAGWLGVLPLVIYSAAWNVAGPVALITLGLADATGIEVAAEAGRSGEAAAAKVAWTNLTRTLLPVAVLALMLVTFSTRVAAFYLADGASAGVMAACLPLVANLLVIDATGFVLSAALRGVRDAAGPPVVDIGATALLVPTAAFLSFSRGMGVQGLFTAMVLAGIVRAVALAWRFHQRTTSAPNDRSLAQHSVTQEPTHV